MKRQLFLTIALLCCVITATYAQLSQYDLNEPFGWATCTSLTQGDDYDMNGGGNGTSITLTSNGSDMRSTILDAIKKYDVIVLDGAQGDFVISKTIELKDVYNKTIVGINNARLCTQFYVTPQITAKLDEVGVKDMNSNGGGGTLSNGKSVGEEREFYTRQTLIDMLNDSQESYRDAGLFYFSGCKNIIMRNLQLVGPGPIDVGGDDLISIINGTSHMWIDHCNLTDGIDGNLDITVKSDFITISWCTFSYTSRAYDHMNSNLIGSDESASNQGANNLNVTWANNIWGEKCNSRMPMVRFGNIHLMNNYYNCAGNSAGINARKDSEILIENNFFGKGVHKIFSDGGGKAYNFSGNVFTEEFTASNKGTVTVPYQYSLYPALDVPDVLCNPDNGAGATLEDPLNIGQGTSTDITDATLKSITVCGITLYTQPGRYNYDVEVDAATSQIDISCVTSHNYASTHIDAPATAAQLPATATITVTAADGTTTLTYTVHITRAMSSDTSLARLTVNGAPATKLLPDLYTYRLPVSATTIEVVATPNFAAAQVSDMLVPDIAELPADATFTVTAEDGTITYYTLELTQSSSQFDEGKTWNFTTWSTASHTALQENSDVWYDMGDGRYEHTFEEMTELGFDETEAITFINDVRIKPSTTGDGYIQGALSMNIPVSEGQQLTFTYSHTSNSKGERQLLVNDNSIGTTGSTSRTTATYTVPQGITTIQVRGSEGLRYYIIEMSAKPNTSEKPDDPDNPDAQVQSWIFDNWAAQGVIPATFESDFTHDGLTIIYGLKAKFANAEKSFDDGKVFTTCYDTGGGGSTDSQAMSFYAQRGDKLNVYCNAGEKAREVVIYNGVSEEYRISADMLEYTFTDNGTYYIYSGGSGIRFYALSLRTSSNESLTTPAATLHYAANTLTTDSDHLIEVYNVQGIRATAGYKTLDISNLQQGIYIVRCGNESLRFIKQ